MILADWPKGLDEREPRCSCSAWSICQYFGTPLRDADEGANLRHVKCAMLFLWCPPVVGRALYRGAVRVCGGVGCGDLSRLGSLIVKTAFM